jgi:hypothetical protein
MAIVVRLSSSVRRSAAFVRRARFFDGTSVDGGRLELEGFWCKRASRASTRFRRGEEVILRTRGSLVPILGWDAESHSKGDSITQQGTHDVDSFFLVSLSLSQNTWRGSRKMLGERSG